MRSRVCATALGGTWWNQCRTPYSFSCASSFHKLPKHILSISSPPWKSHVSGKCSRFSSRALLQNQESLQVKPIPEASTETESVVNANPANKIITENIKRLSTNGRWKRAKELFEKTNPKDTILYNAIIDGAIACKKYDDGMRFFSDMKRLGVKITSAEYATVLKLLGQKGDYTNAKRIWAEHIAAVSKRGEDPWSHWQIHSQDPGSRKSVAGNPTKVCFTGLLNAAANSGNADTVAMHLEEAIAEGASLNRVHFGCLLKSYRRLGNAMHVQQTLQTMRKQSAPASVIEYTLAMGVCTQELAAQYSLAKAQQYLSIIRGEMAIDNVRPNEYFIEEEVATLLGAGWLSTWMSMSTLPPKESVKAALSSMENAFANGIRKSAMLERVEARLQASI